MKSPSTERILHVFDSIAQLRFLSLESFRGFDGPNGQEHLVNLVNAENDSPDFDMGDLSALSFEQGLLEKPVAIHFHSISAAIFHFDRLHDIPFSVSLRGYWNPLIQPEHLSEKRDLILKQRKILEKSTCICIDNKDQKNLIENWFVQLNLFGGGEYYYNFDQAQRITEKCVLNPYWPNYQYWNPDEVSTNKMLWLGAVYGIGLKQNYLSVFGPGTDWERLLPYYRSILNQDSSLRLVVFDEAPLDSMIKRASNMDIPSSYFIQISPSKKHLKVCMKMTVGSLFFPLEQGYNFDALAAFLLMGIPILSDLDSPWSTITNKSWTILDKNGGAYNMSDLNKTKTVRVEALTLFGSAILESTN
jgi:hypothetical protein